MADRDTEAEGGTPHLRRGWTTGSCATGAARAAFEALVSGRFPDPVTVTLPGGQTPAFVLATTAVGNSGATNAGLLAVQILSTTDKRLADALQEYRDALKEKVAESNAQLV